MSNPKGARFERQVLDYLRANGMSVVRVHDGGDRDEGDLRVMVAGCDIVAELKNYRSLTDAINAGFRGLDAKVAEAGPRAQLGCVIVRRHGKPDPADALVVFRLGDLTDRRWAS